MDRTPFGKAVDLFRLAEMAASRPEGVCLVEISAAFDVNLRTAQRMSRALEMVFPKVETHIDSSRRKWWALHDRGLLLQPGVQDGELAALGLAITRAERDGATTESAALASLRARLIAQK